MATLLVRVGKTYYKARVNPKPRMTSTDLDRYARLMRNYTRASKAGKLRLMIILERHIKRMEDRLRINPLIKSKNRASVGMNISWLLKHPRELTAKTKNMRRKQAIAIALSIQRKSGGR